MLIKQNEKSWLKNNSTDKSDNCNQKKGKNFALFRKIAFFL